MWPDTPPVKFVIWGHPHYSHTHSYIHYGFHKAAAALGWDTLWLPNTAEAALQLPDTRGYLFLTEGQVDAHMPKRADAFYVLHNCEQGPYSHVPAAQKLILQVFTKDVYGRDTVPVKGKGKGKDKDNLFEFWQANANTLYAPWATDLLPSEIDATIQAIEAGSQQDKTRNAMFLGTVWGGEHGNIDQINLFRKGCHDQNIPFECLNSTVVEQSESIRQVQQALLAPSLVGRWQKEKGYIPCRIFKTISYGHIGVTNSREAYEVVGGKAVYEADETALAGAALARLDDRALRLDAMRFVRDHHTYMNRLDTFRTVFLMKRPHFASDNE